MLLIPLVAFLTVGFPAAPEEETAPGFEAMASNPFTQGLFDELVVTPGPFARVLVRNVEGIHAGQPFINVTRWADARPYRGRVIELRVSARLDAASVDTSARLWVRVMHADGTVTFEDTGYDQATRSIEWTQLASTGAVGADATDLCFGLLVEGTTPVHMERFELSVMGEAVAADPRHHVPGRWTESPDVHSSRFALTATGEPVQVTSFVPAGYAAEDLPRLWLPSKSLGESYRTGRAILAAMQRADEPPAVISYVDGPSGRIQEAVERALSDAVHSAEQLIAIDQEKDPRLLCLAAGGQGWEQAPSADRRLLDAQLAGDGLLRRERVLLRWVTARHDAAGDRELASVLFDAAMATLEPWNDKALVRQASHSLTGHDCGHDHDHSGHDHHD